MGPKLTLCDTRRINLYPVGGQAPTKVPHAPARAEGGLQGGWDPSEARHLSAMPFHGHTSTLDRCVPLLVPHDLLSGWKSSAWRRSAPRRSRHSAIERSTACEPSQRWRSVGYGPWRSLPARGTRWSRDYWADNGSRTRLAPA